MNEFELIIDHGTPANRARAERYIKSIRRDRNRHKRRLGLALCFLAIVTQYFIDLPAFIICTLAMVYVGGCLAFCDEIGGRKDE